MSMSHYTSSLYHSQIRLLFNRKNKTLRSVLTTKAALKLLEENRKTLMSLDSSISSDESVKELVENILAKPEYKDKRARNLDLDEFLQLLAAFHEVGIHFTS